MPSFHFYHYLMVKAKQNSKNKKAQTLESDDRSIHRSLGFSGQMTMFLNCICKASHFFVVYVFITLTELSYK